ncbi:hypothetical protein BGZ97_002537 [Linnemannia gamsii]|jgi:hypothetical protein|uniref:Uncharacterized protein n=1 Tax=Linnemannia gamsii TaxID=64522 RepID=A0A9P6UIF5_9FUNG|nr:hypothetical protein BGZ97_002537 [Linnemannia gamsii]
MVNTGSLDALPLSPCTNGSLGFGSQLLGGTVLRHVETSSTAELVEHTSTEVAEVAEEVNTEIKEQEETSHTDIQHVCDDQEDKEVDVETVDEDVEALTEDVTAVTFLGDDTEDHEEHVQVGKEDEKHGDQLEEKEEAGPNVVVASPIPAARPISPTVKDITTTEKVASGVPQRPVASGVPIAVQARGLSAASLALKKKQAAENAAAALKAVAVEVPETDSISNRIRMFGGAAPIRTGGLKKCIVRDMVQKFKDVDEKSHEDIAHVVKGHNNAESHGVCSAYSLSTASRPLRPTPRRKMSHELAENETRGIVKKFGGMVNSVSNSSVSSSSGYSKYTDDNDRLGVSQESVKSVKNAKSLFENLARNEAAGAQM